MTAGNDKTMLGRARANGLKIAESAYHIGKGTNQLNQAYSGYSGEQTQHATSLSGQIGSRFPQNYN